MTRVSDPSLVATIAHPVRGAAARPARRTFLLAGAAAVAGLAGCTALGLYPRERAFTAAEIQERVARRFPWRRSYALVDVELTNPIVRLDGERNRVALAFDAALRSPLFGGRPLGGRATLSGVPRWAADTRAFVITAPVLDALEIPGLAPRVADEIRRLGASLAREALDGMPLYTLRPEDSRWFGQELEPESVTIEGERLVLRVRPRGADTPAPPRAGEPKQAP